MGQAGSQDQGSAPLQQQQITGDLAGPAAQSTDERAEALVVPTVLQWSTGGTSVFVTGSFNNWGERIPLRRSGVDYVVCLNLLPGTYQYKFIVDSEWRFAPDQPTVRDEMGNINNCITVEDQQMYLHEDPCSGFFGDNPNNAYTQVLPDEIILAKEPPLAPVHLAVIPLNFSPVKQPHIASWSLQPPLSVTLQHMCIQHSSNPSVTAVSTTQRFRSKYVTIVIYKPHICSSNRTDAGDQFAERQYRDGWAGKGFLVFRGSEQQGHNQGHHSVHSQPQLPSQGCRVSWSDGPGQALHGSEVLPTNAYAQHQPLMSTEATPVCQPLESAVASSAFSIDPSQIAANARPESMDLWSRPASHGASMDISDWQTDAHC